jgi:hypothetical protein
VVVLSLVSGVVNRARLLRLSVCLRVCLCVCVSCVCVSVCLSGVTRWCHALVTLLILTPASRDEKVYCRRLE